MQLSSSALTLELQLQLIIIIGQDEVEPARNVLAKSICLAT